MDHVRAKQYQNDLCKTHSQCTFISQTEQQDRKASNKHDRIGNGNFGQSMSPAASQGADTQQSRPRIGGSGLPSVQAALRADKRDPSNLLVVGSLSALTKPVGTFRSCRCCTLTPSKAFAVSTMIAMKMNQA